MRNFLFLILFLPFVSNGQARYFVYFKDKVGVTQNISNPSTFLSERSIERRSAQRINITEKDLPVSPVYLNNLKQLGFTIVGKSKWLNAALVEGSATQLQNLKNAAFISKVQGDTDIRGNANPTPNARLKSKFDSPITSIDYGNSSNQIKMIGADTMHAKGYTGKGMLIGVIDAGFIRVNQAEAFAHLRAGNKIKRTYNFVYNTTDVYRDHTHGTNVLSTISSTLQGKLIGTAPEADVALYVSEDDLSETKQEEVFWVFAAEDADSLGVDVLNTSLGYYNFDDPAQNYSYEDMDGETSIIVKAANYASQIGILVVNSAGNEGNSAWRYIGTPADGENVIAIGAVSSTKTKAGFSSFGPTSDNRIKPDVTAMGQATILSNNGSNITSGNGTSYSSPIIAGFLAGLKQQFPTLTALQIREALIKSADRYNNPDNSYGYGIPSYSRFVDIVQKQYFVLGNEPENLEVITYPNPVYNGQDITIKVGNTVLEDNHEVTLINSTGKVLQNNVSKNKLKLESLAEGVYILQFNYLQKDYSHKLLIKK